MISLHMNNRKKVTPANLIIKALQEIWKQSVPSVFGNNQLKITVYVTVSVCDVYHRIKLQKLECDGHIQKRIAYQLLKKTKSGVRAG